MSGYPNRNKSKNTSTLQNSKFLQKPFWAVQLAYVIRLQIDIMELSFTS